MMLETVMQRRDLDCSRVVQEGTTTASLRIVQSAARIAHRRIGWSDVNHISEASPLYLRWQLDDPATWAVSHAVRVTDRVSAASRILIWEIWLRTWRAWGRSMLGLVR
jgi:hypothetical protein